MSQVRVLVGTRKGGFVINSDAKRQRWSVSGPFFSGWEIYHFKGSPADPNRIYASQTSGWFGQVIQRSDDAGKTWKAINRGLKSQYLPEPTPEVGFCVHRIAMHRSRPGVLFMQLHQGGGAFRTDDAGDLWQDVKGNLPTDFGFPIDIHAHEPSTIFVVPMDPFMRVPPEGKLRVY